MNIPNTKTPLLDQVDLPEDLRKLDKSQLRQFADELRTDLIDIVSVTGGHFGAGLGVVELTTALHYVFKTPDDRIIWDVGHQAYPHKILTGRRARMRTLRQGGDILRICQKLRVDQRRILCSGALQGDLAAAFWSHQRHVQGVAVAQVVFAGVVVHNASAQR